jgi:large subunit ribosomal protein L27
MATKKSGGSTRLGRDSNPKYLGIKLYAGEKVKIGQVIVRQKGTKVRPGKNVKLGKDYTIFAMKDGVVKYTTKRVRKFDGTQKTTKLAHVE